MLIAVQKKLEMSGFDVLSARSVEQAMGYMQDVAGIKVIWLDHYLLGKESGLDFIATLKNNNEWKHIPVFVVSNTATADKVQSYLQLGAEKYYTKSDYRLEQIIADIQSFLDQKKE